jgi:hypothetical protein
MKSIKKIIKEELLKEVGGYDDKIIMAKHSGEVMEGLVKVFSDVLGVIKVLGEKVDNGTFDRFSGEEILLKLSDGIDEAIRVTGMLIKEFTEDGVILEGQNFIKNMNEFKRKIRLLSGLPSNFTQSEYENRIMKLILGLEPTIRGYADALKETNTMFMNRFNPRYR